MKGTGGSVSRQNISVSLAEMQTGTRITAGGIYNPFGKTPDVA